MHMSEKETIDLIWSDGEGLPVSVSVVSFLEQSAVDEDPDSVRIQKVARTRCLMGGAQES